MTTKNILPGEVYRLAECLEALAEYHNQVSAHHSGFYPGRPIEDTLELFREALNSKTSMIFAIEESDRIAGFCKIDIHGEKGKLDYLIVKEEYRGRGYGALLMDWAMKAFRECGTKHVEVKIIDGNAAAQRLYEKYGFVMNAHILWHILSDDQLS